MSGSFQKKIESLCNSISHEHREGVEIGFVVEGDVRELWKSTRTHQNEGRGKWKNKSNPGSPYRPSIPRRTPGASVIYKSRGVGEDKVYAPTSTMAGCAASLRLENPRFTGTQLLVHSHDLRHA